MREKPFPILKLLKVCVFSVLCLSLRTVMWIYISDEVTLKCGLNPSFVFLIKRENKPHHKIYEKHVYKEVDYVQKFLRNFMHKFNPLTRHDKKR